MKKSSRRQFTTSTIFVEGQMCKIFLQPLSEFKKGFWIWNTGFAVGKSNRQLNDWYWKRKNKRARSINKKMTGKAGLKTIKKGFEEVLKLRWNIYPGDVLFIDCTSGLPSKQFRAFSRWHRYHPEWTIDYVNKIFFWHRPPHANDPVWDKYEVIGKTPANPLQNTEPCRHEDCFSVLPLHPHKARSKYQN